MVGVEDDVLVRSLRSACATSEGDGQIENHLFLRLIVLIKVILGDVEKAGGKKVWLNQISKAPK